MLAYIICYIICFLLGSLLGTLALEFVDRFGCSKRYYSPMPKKLFIAFIAGLVAVWLYCWEVQNQMLLPEGLMKELYSVVLCRYVVHLILLTLLLAATLTDFYEMIVPDTITITGTLLGAFVVIIFSSRLCSALPATEFFWTEDSFYPLIAAQAVPIHVWSPNPPETLSWLTMWLLLTALVWFWCFAMLDRVWYTRLPIRKAAAIFGRYLCRPPKSKGIIIFALSIALILTLDNHLETKITLLSALIGMAIGMVLVWAVRIVARWILGIEAMGFGDVTLMGMIGTFLAWQAVLLIFFIAPFFGLVYALIHWFLGRGRAVPYGPFLCLATLVVILAWSPIWSATAEIFSFGLGIISIALLILLVLFGGLLHVVHQIFSRLRQ